MNNTSNYSALPSNYKFFYFFCYFFVKKIVQIEKPEFIQKDRPDPIFTVYNWKSCKLNLPDGKGKKKREFV